MTIRSTGENAYFAASNSVSGFQSYYREIFDAARVKHVYAIKGGPGTGKSRFLRDVAEYAQARSWEAEYVYCSSDPNSLDGVILTRTGEGSVALLDATAPHIYEPRMPGAREEIVNLGVFWDDARLAERVEEIEDLNREKSEAYRRAYRFLSGMGEMSRNRDSLVYPFVRRARIRSFAERLMQSIPRGDGYLPSPALIHSVGMHGEVGLDTYFAQARRLYIIEDCRGAAQYLMAELGDLVRDRQLAVRISHDPLESQKIDGLFLCDTGIAFAVSRAKLCEYPCRRIHMRRFVDTASMRPVRAELNYTERMRRALRCGAIDAMEKVREIHFRLEDIYISAMDFAAKEAFTRTFCEGHFS